MTEHQSKAAITMTDTKLTRRGVPLYKSNPFLSGDQLTVRTKRITNKAGDMYMVQRDTGEVKADIAGFWESHEVDATRFVKLFVNGVAAIKELSGAGTKVFEVLYLRVQAEVSKDQVLMAYAAVDQDLTPMSAPTYDRGMRELIAKGFIAATPVQGMYWLNLDYLWNGDRLAFVREYRKANPALSITSGDL